VTYLYAHYRVDFKPEIKNGTEKRSCLAKFASIKYITLLFFHYQLILMIMSNVFKDVVVREISSSNIFV